MFNHYFHRAQRQILAGLILIVPIAVTVLAAVFLYNVIDRFVGPLVDRILVIWPFSAISDQRHLIGIGFRLFLSILMTLLVLFLAGFVSTTIFIHRIYAFGEQLVLKIPFIKTVYGLSKQIVQLVSTQKKSGFKRMAMVEFPREGMYSLAFVTGETHMNGDSRRFISVFVPKVPNPTTGFLLILPEEQVQILNIGIDDGIKMVMSGGIITPEHLTAEMLSSVKPE